ncbi:FAD-dependent monooxygenase [Spirillospora sp. NPDC048819]|uniref:FAD-dependent monooxygenase n=1 Tax=Spirillospora sp. NPDC048819 TaxID=3155268 RepID=UPI0033F0A755
MRDVETAGGGRFSADVVIAGGGPVGLALAVELGTRGVSCLIVEPRAAVSRRAPRAKTVSIRTMEHLRRWGIAERVRDAAVLPRDWPAEAVYCTSMTGHELRRFANIFGMRRVAEAAEASLQIPQPLVEEVLRDVVAGLPSVRLMTGYRVAGVRQDHESVSASITSQEADPGGAGHVEGRYLVACDGGASVVRRGLAIGTTGEVFSRSYFGVVFRSRALMARAAATHGRATHYWVVSPEGNGMVGPMDGEEVFFANLQGVTAAASNEEIVAGLHRVAGEPVDIEIMSTDPWRPRVSVAESFRAGRVFLAGDAAHANPPWGGHGFNTGVGDAVNLGWKLAAVLQGWSAGSVLDSYDRERRTAAMQTVADAAANMRALDDALVSPDILGQDDSARAARSALRAEIAEVKESEFYSRGLVLGYHYADSPLVIGDGTRPPAPHPVHYTPTTVPGVRLPHAWLDDDRVAIYDRLGPRYSLVAVGDVPDPSRSAAAGRGVGIGELPIVRAAMGRAPGYDRPQILLVRPDQHIAWRGEREAGDFTAILHRVTGGHNSALTSA